MAEARAAATDQELVADELAAAADEDRGRTVKHARYYWLLLAEAHLNRRLFGDMLHRIWALLFRLVFPRLPVMKICI